MTVSRGWSLDGVDPPPGVALFAHVELGLRTAGSGPLPPEAQKLPDEPPHDPSKLRWIWGGRDAVGVGSEAQPKEPSLAAAAAVRAVTQAPPETVVALAMAELVDALAGPRAVDRFMDAIRQDSDLDRGRVAEVARWLCCNGTRRGMVKAGLALLGATGTPSDTFVIQRLGLLEELTLYAVVALRNLLPEPDMAIFELARHVTGWGRIQAIWRLNETTNPEIQGWLLRGGAENDVMTEEIAYVAATTGHLLPALKGQADSALLEHGGELLRALAQGGPAKDMTHYEDGAAAIGAWLGHMRSAQLTPKRLDCLVYLERYLGRWARDNQLISEAERQALHASATEVLARPDCPQVVTELLGSDRILDVTLGLSLAGRFAIDARPTARSWLQRLPLNGYLWQWLLQHASADELDALLDEAYRLLPLSALASGPEDDLGLGLDYAADGVLRTIIQHLRERPPSGWPLVATALKNRVTGVRNGALAVLNAWPTDAWPPAARDSLGAALDIEPRADVREGMQALLDHGKLPERQSR